MMKERKPSFNRMEIINKSHTISHTINIVIQNQVDLRKEKFIAHTAVGVLVFSTLGATDGAILGALVRDGRDAQRYT